jgi:hypothetical protein
VVLGLVFLGGVCVWWDWWGEPDVYRAERNRAVRVGHRVLSAEPSACALDSKQGFNTENTEEGHGKHGKWRSAWGRSAAEPQGGA